MEDENAENQFRERPHTSGMGGVGVVRFEAASRVFCGRAAS